VEATVVASEPKPSILVVEDDEPSMVLACAVLEELGYRPVPAGSAEEAVQLLQTSQPSLVLTDLHLPGEDGLALARRLKSDPATASIPIVALTAHTGSELRSAALAAGCDHFMAKPLDLRLLARVVAEIIDPNPRSRTSR
jgi:CheY-like chemotaxis protein